MEGIHHVYNCFGNLGAVAKVVFGKEGAVLGRFHDGVRGFFTQAVDAV